MEEYVPCNICNLDETRLLFVKDGVQLVRCERCGLIYVNPRLKQEALHDQYQETYFDYYLNMEASDRLTFQRRLVEAEKLVPPGRLLDVGCGLGTFLQVAVSRGWDATGVDISAVSVEHCQKQGLHAVCGNLPELKLAAGFDFVNMEDSIEHLPDPKAMLTEVFSLLKPGGWLLVRTPDIGSFLARFLGKRWIQVKPREHIYYFTAATLRQLLTVSGFKVKNTESLGRVYYWALVAEKLQSHNRLLGKASGALLNKLHWDQKHIYLNLGDEIGVWAYKP